MTGCVCIKLRISLYVHMCVLTASGKRLHSLHRDRLERVQSFAAKVVSGRWSESPSVIKGSLKWPALQQRRQFQQLSVCNRILCGHSLTPSAVFQAHPRPSRVHANSKPLFRQRVQTAQHGSSFFHRVVPVWNSLSDRVVTCASHLGLKRSLRTHLFLTDN